MLEEYQKIPVLYEWDASTKEYTDKISDPNVAYLVYLPWLASEKYDGMNIMVHYDGYKVEIYGRTDAAILPKEVEELLEKTFYNSELIFESLFKDCKDVTLYMECYGGKVQGSKGRKWYGGIDESLIGFDVKIGFRYLDRRLIKEIFSAFGVPCVEFFEVKNLYEAIDIVRNKAKAQSENSEEPYFEGLVCTPLTPLLDIYGHRIIVKIKCETFYRREQLGKAPSKKKLVHQKDESPKAMVDVYQLTDFPDIEKKLNETTFAWPASNIPNIKLGKMFTIKYGDVFVANLVVIKIMEEEATLKTLKYIPL